MKRNVKCVLIEECGNNMAARSVVWVGFWSVFLISWRLSCSDRLFHNAGSHAKYLTN